MIIGISGPSCSGKTTLARHLAMFHPNTILIHQDDFYLPESQLPVRHGHADWDCPEAFDFAKFYSVLQTLDTTRYTSYEPESHLISKYVSSLRKSVQDQLKEIEKLVIVDGILLFHDKNLSNVFDVRVFVDGDYDILKARREQRVYDTMEGAWKDPPGYFDTVVWPSYLYWNKDVLKDSDAQGILKFKTERDDLDDMIRSVVNEMMAISTKTV